MELQKINFKIFAAEPDGVALTEFIPIFHSWIQATDGDYHDVADYGHMRGGPGILLLAHEANIALDETGNRRGLLYNHKQPLAGSNGEKLRRVLQAALETCRKIEDEPSLKGRFGFSGSEALFLVNDRLLAPNTEETFNELRPDLESLAGKLYPGSPFTLHREPDCGRRFSVHIKAEGAFDVATLLRNLGAAGSF
ncbi:MAG TPA: hypothetical protein VGB25_06155 [Candidatus Binatia bacterium]